MPARSSSDSLLGTVMHNRRETALLGGAECDTLNRVRMMTDAVIHLAPGQHHLDRAADDARTERRQRHVWPRAQRRAKCASDERGDDADVIRRHTEDCGDLVARVMNPLR